MTLKYILSWLLKIVTICTILSGVANSAERVTYLILPDTVEPIMIVRDGDPLAGGILTEIVKLLFMNSAYVVEPRVLPWQRMRIEFNQSDDWIVHGFNEMFEHVTPHEISELPIFPFNHVSVTMKDSAINIQNFDDLNNRTLILVDNFQYPGLDQYLDSISSGETTANIGVVRAFTPSGALQMLRHGRGDVVIGWQARLIYNLNLAELSIEDVEFQDATEIVPTKNIHLVFSSRASDEFRTFVNSGIKRLTESGQLFDIVEKYYNPAMPPEF